MDGRRKNETSVPVKSQAIPPGPNLFHSQSWCLPSVGPPTMPLRPGAPYLASVLIFFSPRTTDSPPATWANPGTPVPVTGHRRSVPHNDKLGFDDSDGGSSWDTGAAGVPFLPPFPLTLERLPLTFKAPGKQVKPGDGWDAEKSQRGGQEFPPPSADRQHPLRGGSPYAQRRVSARSVESSASLIILSAREEQREGLSS